MHQKLLPLACFLATALAVSTASAQTVVDVRVAAGNDDAEERADGSMYLTSSDLELVFDGGGDQTVGMRFNGVDIPQGAAILNAFVQFKVDETPSNLTNLMMTERPSITPRRLLPLRVISHPGREPRPPSRGRCRRGRPWEKRGPINGLPTSPQ